MLEQGGTGAARVARFRTKPHAEYLRRNVYGMLRTLDNGGGKSVAFKVLLHTVSGMISILRNYMNNRSEVVPANNWQSRLEELMRTSDIWRGEKGNTTNYSSASDISDAGGECTLHTDICDPV